MLKYYWLMSLNPYYTGSYSMSSFGVLVVAAMKS